MKVTEWSRRILAARREKRSFQRRGYEQIRGPSDLENARHDHVITDAVIAADGKHVWVKLEKRPVQQAKGAQL